MRGAKTADEEMAILYTPSLSATLSGRCLKFWYIMPTSAKYRMSIHIRKAGVIMNALWGMQKINILGWHVAHVTIKSTIPFEVTHILGLICRDVSHSVDPFIRLAQLGMLTRITLIRIKERHTKYAVHESLVCK